MAGKNRSSRTKAAEWAGIPKADRGAVTLLIGTVAASGRKVTPKAAYAQLQALDRKRKAEQAAKDADQKAKADAHLKEHATQEIETALGKLASVRDLLERLEQGRHEGFDSETVATFAKATMIESVSSMEQALVDLGVIAVPFPQLKVRSRGEGWFKEAIS